MSAVVCGGVCVLLEASRYQSSSVCVFARMYHCGLTFQSCYGIGDALKNEPSTLLELNLSCNNLEDRGLTILSEGMHAWCSLQKLK